MSELPIFHTKNLEIGKTYKGLINNKTFTVTGTTTDRFDTESGSYVEKIYFTAIDEDKHSFTISSNLHLYIQEVTKWTLIWIKN